MEKTVKIEEFNEIQTIAGAMIASCYKKEFFCIRDTINQITEHLMDIMEKHKIPHERKEINEAVVNAIANVLKL